MFDKFIEKIRLYYDCYWRVYKYFFFEYSGVSGFFEISWANIVNSKKSIETAFRSKLNVGTKNPYKGSSSGDQSKE